MLKYIIAHKDGTPVNVRTGLDDNVVLVAESLKTLDAHWKSGINDAAETITVVEAKPNQSIMLTDIIITSSKKVASSTVTIQFSDGTNTEVLMVMEGASAPIEFPHAFQGGLKGWKEADFQVVTDQAAMYVVTLVGYVHLSTAATKGYGAWNAER